MPAGLYDDERDWTAAEAALVREALADVERRITDRIGPLRRPVLDVAFGEAGLPCPCLMGFSEREWRLIRYALGVAVAGIPEAQAPAPREAGG